MTDISTRSAAGGAAGAALSLRKLAPAIFLAPAVLLLIVYLLYPLVDSFRLSLLDWNGLGSNARFVGLDNWIKLSSDVLFWKAAWNNILLAVFSVVIQMPIAVVLALVLATSVWVSRAHVPAEGVEQR